METSLFAVEWNAKFGVQPPEWALNVQDVGKELAECEARIEKLQTQLNQELFLLEWLRKSAIPVPISAENSHDSEELEGTSPSSTSFEDAVSEHRQPEEANEAPSHSPLGLFKSKSKESVKSRGSSDYYSAKQEGDSSDSASDSGESRVVVRKRLVKRVTSSDERIARAVKRRLIEQGRHWSCHFLALSDSSQSPSTSPDLNKRSMSDPDLHRHKIVECLPSSGDPVRSIVTVEPALVSPEQTADPTTSGNFPGGELPPDEFIFGSHKRVGSRKDRKKLQEDMFAGPSSLRKPSDESSPARHWSASSSGSAPSSAGEAEGGTSLDNFLYDGYTILSEERDTFDPLLSGLSPGRVHKGVYTHSLYISSDKDDHLSLLANGTTQENGEQLPLSAPPTSSAGYFTRGLQSLPESGLLFSREQPEATGSSVGSKRSSRSSNLEDEECQTPKGEDDTGTMTLTRATVEIALEQKRQRMIDLADTPESSLEKTLTTASVDSLGERPELSVRTWMDVSEAEKALGMDSFGIPEVSSEPNLHGFDDNIELDEATISIVMLNKDAFGSRSNSVSSLPGLMSSTSSFEASPPDSHVSPSHQLASLQGVSLRSASGKKRDRKRMGNAELDENQHQQWEEYITSESSSPSHASFSSRSSISPLSEEGCSNLSPGSPTFVESPLSMSPGASQPPSTRSSRFYPVRRSTVVVHGEVMVIRKLVVAGIVSAEKNFLECLTVMKEFYRKPLLALLTTTQPILPEREVNTVFYRIEDLFDLHTSLHEKLEPQLAHWCVSSCIGDFFVDLCRNLRLYKDYLEMYHRSQECLDRCRQESVTFRKFLEDVHATVVVQYKDVPRVNELLRRPVERLQSYSLVLNDLCQHTPNTHPDYQILRQSLLTMTEFIASTHDPQRFSQLSGGYNRELVKQGLVVELSDNRKVRRLFLFHDVIVSAKQKPTRNGMRFEPKWYIPLADLTFHSPEEKPSARPVLVTSDMELSVMKNKIAEIKAQLNLSRRERTSSQPDRDGSFRRNIRALHPIKGSKSVKLKKKLQEQKVSYWVASPSLPLRLFGKGKQIVLLLHSEDERESWVSAIKKLHPKVVSSVSLSPFELQDLLSRQPINDLHKVEEMVHVPTTSDDEYLNGIMRVRVVSAGGLKAKPVGLFCCLELDEYGKFDRKARTDPSNTDLSTLTTTWDQDFELEVAGAHIIKVMICSKSLLKEDCYAQGKHRLSVSELRQNKRHKTEINLHPQGSITLIIEYFTSLASMGRKPAYLSSGVFGVSLEVVSQRERHDIPLIVQTCVDEIERRGMSEVGVYRMSGVLRDVEELRQAFDTDYLKAQVIAFDTDIHAVAGLLKKYFRELPDPLFTDEFYMSFVHGLGLSDPEAREQCMITLLYSLPPVNLKTAIFLFKHLRRVAANSSENKMTLANLATVFGPNLLRPAIKTMEDQPAMRVDVVTPVNVVLFYLSCSEEILNENVLRCSPTPTGPSWRQDGPGKSRKSLVTEEQDGTGDLFRKGSRRTPGKRESII